MHRFFVFFLVLAVALTFTATGSAAEEQLRLGVVLSIGGLGDKSFNDAVYGGIQKLRKSTGCLIDVVEPADVQSIEHALEYLSGRNLHLIAAVGLFANDAIRRVAGRHPDQSYVMLDSVVSAPNVLSIIFNEEEGSFYAGALAGLLTKSQKVGFLGGMSSPVIATFEKGFRNGVSFVNPTAEVVTEYAGTTPEAFQDPDAGKKIGMQMAAAQVDLVYHAAGATGLGLMEAARHKNFLVIGVDSDQSALVPGKVAASMVKRLDIGLDKAVQAVREKRFKGAVLTLGLADIGVELVLSRFNKSLFTPVIMDRLREVESFLLHQTKPAPHP
jgi:basic membrane protein A